MKEEFDWEQIKASMREGVVVVTFLKADGTVREMQCTLADFLLPETAGSGRASNADVVVVFDLEVEQWRSFRKDRVINVEVV